MKKIRNQGFSTVEVLLVAVVIAAITGLGIYIYRTNHKTKNNSPLQTSKPAKASTPATEKQPDLTTFENDNFKLKYPSNWGWQQVNRHTQAFCANSPEAKETACYTGNYDVGAAIDIRLTQPSTDYPKIDSVDPNHKNKQWKITKQGWVTLNNQQVYQFEVDASSSGGSTLRGVYTRIPYPNSSAWLEFHYNYSLTTGDKYSTLQLDILKSIELKSDTQPLGG